MVVDVGQREVELVRVRGPHTACKDWAGDMCSRDERVEGRAVEWRSAASKSRWVAVEFYCPEWEEAPGAGDNSEEGLGADQAGTEHCSQGMAQDLEGFG
jgi:hypothetical protein